jgi:hypothetical protein
MGCHPYGIWQERLSAAAASGKQAEDRQQKPEKENPQPPEQQARRTRARNGKAPTALPRQFDGRCYGPFLSRLEKPRRSTIRHL